MVDYVWSGVSSDWNLATNWTPNGIPTSVDNVTINGSGYILCWSTADAECNNLTLTVAMTEMLIFGFNATIYGDLTMDGGYFSGSGGPDYIIEIKGNVSSSGSATIAIGTGTGRDHEVILSGITKTFVWNSTASASFQHLTISGEYVFSGTKLSVALVYQEFSVTGILDISKTGLTINRIDLRGTWGAFTGTIEGLGRIFYYYESTSVLPTGGTIQCRYFRLYLEDSLILVNPTVFLTPCEFEIEYRSDAQIVRFTATARHYFYKFTIHCDLTVVDTALLDFATNDAEIYCDATFDIYKNAFPSAVFTIDLGDGIHVFRGTVDFYFSYSAGSATQLVVNPGEGTLFLYPKGLRVKTL